MILEKQPELLADAIRAASEYYHIAPVYIEKDYWMLQKYCLTIT